MDLARWHAIGDARADLQHVRTENEFPARLEMIGVVLHERGAAGHADRRGFERAQEYGRLPVTFSAEAETVGHQTLHRESGQLAQRAEVFEVRGERAVRARGQEITQTQLDARRVPQRLVALAAGTQRRGYAV